MRSFNYSAIKQQKWDSDILGLIAVGEPKKEGNGKNTCYFRLNYFS